MLRVSQVGWMVTALGAVWLMSVAGASLDARQSRPAQASPASQRPPETRQPQEYPPELVEAGRARFAGQCGFCHGRDGTGGEGGTDLTHSLLVAEDVRGDRIRPVIRDGRPDRGMPPFSLSEEDLAAIVAFIHHRKNEADTVAGGRRSVDPADLQTGDAAAGRQYFQAACAHCHQPGSAADLAGIASRYQGLALLHRMLYPGSGGRGAGPAPARPQITVTTGDGAVVTGTLAYRDEFTIALRDASGWYRSWATRLVRVTVADPLAGHVEQLERYTDRTMHDVLAYLQTLR